MKMKQWAMLALFLLGGVFLLGVAASDEAASAGEELKIGAEERIGEDVHFRGLSFENAGVIDGGLFVAAQNVLVEGTVNGNVFIAGEDVVIGGVIEGDLFVAANRVTITGFVRGSVYTGCQEMVLQSTGEIGRSLYGAGSDLILYGAVDRNAEVYASSLVVKGLVAGDLKYSAKTANIVSGTVKGQISEHTLPSDAERLAQQTGTRIFATVSSLVSALFVWLLLTFVFKETKSKTAGLFRNDWLKSFFLYGLLGMMASFVLSLVLMVSVIGLSFGVILLMVAVSGIYLGGSVFLVTLAGYLGEKFPKLAVGNNILLVAGLALVVSILRMLPFIGGVVSFVVVVGGFGLILGSFLTRQGSSEEHSLIL